MSTVVSLKDKIRQALYKRDRVLMEAQEDAEAVERINGSGAGIIFIGLGCPKQDFATANDPSVPIWPGR